MFSRANAVGLPNRVGGMGSVGAWVSGWRRSNFGLGGVGRNLGVGGVGEKPT